MWRVDRHRMPPEYHPDRTTAMRRERELHLAGELAVAWYMPDPEAPE